MTTNESAPDPTAGEPGCHRGYPYCDGRRPCACPCHDLPATPDADDASERERCASSHDGHPCGVCDASTAASEGLVPIEECIDADALLDAMIHAGAWAVLEASMDTADREPGKALYEQTVADVRTWLAAREAAAATKARADERERIFGVLLRDDTRRLMAQEYLTDRSDYHGQNLTRHAQAMAAALRAAFDGGEA